ncbi:MAG: glycoside hydrolase family 44 protein [Anaerolineae bacterium]|nr:glycoside hydrolase family 44 protein [Anaerolineae bacterium]
MWKRGYVRTFLFFVVFIGLVIGLMFWSLGGSQAQADLLVYSDGLENGWASWSWDTTVNLSQSTPKHSGSSSLAATFTQSWASLYLHSSIDINAGHYEKLRFFVHGGNSGGHTLQVKLADGNNNLINSPVAITLSPNVWTQIEIPLVDLLAGQTTISGIVWQEGKGSIQPIFYIDDVSFVIGDYITPPTPSPGSGPALTINVTLDQHPIDANIYGMNFADEALAADLQLPVNRWGGNTTTRYNWQIDATNQAGDWFFMNTPNDNNNLSALPDGSASDKFIEANQATGTKTMLTVPMIGWTAKSRNRDCGFSAVQYPSQQAFDGVWGCGNGLMPNGTAIIGNDPLDTSLAIDETFVNGWVNHVVERYGTPDVSGVQFYNLDNEPMLWHRTHPDVHPQPLGYDQLRNLTYQYGSAIKAADPNAKILGPVARGWTTYFYSALDQAGGDDWWNNPPDRKAHGDIPLVEWYLWQMQQYELDTGVRLLDYLDLHYYPEAAGVALSDAGDEDIQARRLRSTRSLWDPTYIDESWIGEPITLIPRMKAWVEKRYPGTKLAITEYNWGALDDINGALAQADVLGIFGREGLDLATLWSPPQAHEPGAFAFRLYRNYDGHGSMFGDVSVSAESSDPTQLSIYAARRESDNILTVVVINKSSQNFTSHLTLLGYTPASQAAVYRYSADNLNEIVRFTDPSVADEFTTDFPSYSMTLFEFSPGSEQPLVDTVFEPVIMQ